MDRRKFLASAACIVALPCSKPAAPSPAPMPQPQVVVKSVKVIGKPKTFSQVFMLGDGFEAFQIPPSWTDKSDCMRRGYVGAKWWVGDKQYGVVNEITDDLTKDEVIEAARRMRCEHDIEWDGR